MCQAFTLRRTALRAQCCYIAWAACAVLCVQGRSGRPTAHFIEGTRKVQESYKRAQKVVDERWRDTWSPDLPCAQPKHHGYMQKQGSGSKSVTMFINVAESEQFIFEKLPIYTGCQVFISDKWKFIYIRQPKSSSTAVLTSIKQTLCGLTDANEECHPYEFRRIRKSDPRKWKEYFVFTFVRNPWIRMLSAYRMMNKHFLYRRSGADGKTPGDHCTLDFESFTRDSNSMRRMCPDDQCCAYIGPPLQSFIPAFIDPHINDQAHCIFLPGGQSLVDFVGATETIDDDWSQVLTEINRRSGSSFNATTVQNPNGHGAKDNKGVENLCSDPATRAFFNETTLYNIAHQYAMDIVRYGYM